MKRLPAVTLAGLLVAGLVAGCTSTPQESRINKNREIYETWPLDTRQAVLDGKVEQGMTTDMVRVSWGEPTKIVDSNANEQVWIYEKGGDPGTMLDPGGAGVGPGMVPLGVGSRRAALMGVSPNNGMIGPSGMIAGTGVSSMPIYTQPTPAEVREVVFRDGIVYRADLP